MWAETPADLGRLIRDRRRDLGLSQQDVAERVGAGRRWVTLLEAGHARAELGLVLRALNVLGLSVDVVDPQVAATAAAADADAPIDLDEVLAGYDESAAR